MIVATKEVNRDAAGALLGLPNPALFRNFGVFLSPADLPVGEYQFRTVLHDPVYDPIYGGPFDATITFYVDPAGSPACN